MRICPTCGVCYEDQQKRCEGLNHLPLEFQRAGSRIIGGKYRLDQRLGGGNTGIVYKSLHQALLKERAIKLLRPDFAKSDPHGRLRLQREALTVCKFDHVNVVRLYDYGWNPVSIGENGHAESYDELYLAMELVEGQTLKAYLTKCGCLSVLEAVEIAIQIAAGLSEVHAHEVVHRDLKPANLILTYDRHGNQVLKIIDFGSVKLASQPEEPIALDLTGQMFIGSPQYASPEMCCNRPVDFRSDIYSLGLILYEMVSGSSPFTATDFLGWLNKHAYDGPRPLTGVSQELNELIMTMLSKDPNERPQTAVEVVDKLKQIKNSKSLYDERVSSETVSESTSQDETVVAAESLKVSPEPTYPQEKQDQSKINGARSTGPIAIFVLSLAASVIFTVNVLRLSYQHGTSQQEAESAATVDNQSAEEEEFVTVTDLNIRALPSAAGDKIGLAEKGSRVRVLSREDRWCQIIVVRHGRTKDDPDSQDKGWVIGDKLTSVSGG